MLLSRILRSRGVLHIVDSSGFEVGQIVLESPYMTAVKEKVFELHRTNPNYKEDPHFIREMKRKESELIRRGEKHR